MFPATNKGGAKPDSGSVMAVATISLSAPQGALASSERARFTQPALLNGAVGLVMAPRGQLVVALRFTITADKITEIDPAADPARLRHLELDVLDD
jgi:hypothetical protein